MNDISGLYMSDCWPAEPSMEAQDLSTATALWEMSEQIIVRSDWVTLASIVYHNYT